VKPGAVRKHPTRKNPVHLSRQPDLIDLDETRGVRCLGRRARIADARGNPQGAELHRLADGDLEMRDAPRHLVEGGKHGDRILDLLGVGESGAEQHCREGEA
jgi:hypothetical protein